METLEGLRKRIATTKNLRSIVSSMKTLSAVSVGQYEKAAKALNTYTKTIQDGLHVVLKSHKASSKKSTEKKAIAVVFGSDPGLVGRFNKAIAKYAASHLEENNFSLSKTTFVAVGKSLAIKLHAQDCKPDYSFSMPGSVKNITKLAHTLVINLNEIKSKTGASHIFMYYNRKTNHSINESYASRLLPLDESFFEEICSEKWPSNQIPLCPGNAEENLAAFIEQLLFIEIHRAIAESLASEHMTRMISMQAAEKNIDEHLDIMNNHYQQKRQESITEELLDVVSGAEVLHTNK